MGRPLAELKARAGILAMVRDTLRLECIGIARRKSPSVAFDEGSRAARMCDLEMMSVQAVAKATRWLAVIRRDHGEKIFDETVRTLTTTPTT